MDLPFFDATAIRSSMPFDLAITTIERALRAGVDPEEDSPRLFSSAPDGEFLILPAGGHAYSGVKVATIAPNNPARGLQKIQAVYLLFDSGSLSPLVAMDGTELTAIRTPASTLTAIKHIVAAPGADPVPAAPDIVVFGAGLQGLNHIRAARTVFPEARFTVIGQRRSRVDALATTLAAEGITVRNGSLEHDVPAADIIICVTSSRTPLFDGNLPADHAIIASVGQHGLDAREVDATLVHRSDVAVEGRASSWRESGNLIPARDLEEWQRICPPNLKDLVAGAFRRTPGRPALYTGVGMAWQDLVMAAAVYGSRNQK